MEELHNNQNEVNSESLGVETIPTEDKEIPTAESSNGIDTIEITSDDHDDSQVENENIFNPEKDQQEKTKKHIKLLGKIKKTKKYFLIPLGFVIFFLVLIIGWQIIPKKELNVCILDKTILTLTEENGLNKDTLYRKHQGLTWLLTQQKYVKEDGTYYDYTKDYFGPYLDSDGKIEGTRELTELNYVPDVMYITDVYGATNDSMGYFDNEVGKGRGFTSTDMSVVAYARESNATVIGEMELFNSCSDTAIYNQVASTFGVKPLGWVGRYIFELQDFTDVPDWAPPMYEQQEGVEWQFSGPGILLVSNTGKIIILEQKTDFEYKNLLQIYINEKYKKEFKDCNKQNFYNWFELIESNYGTEEISTFEFNVNATGMEKMKDVSKTPRFAAIVRKAPKDEAPTYYFAGDFNDYVSQKNFNKFLLADRAFRLISYDSAGDITNFYWDFYNPLIKKILKDTYKRLKKENYDGSNDPAKYTSIKIENGEFLTLKNKKWKKFELKALSINGSMPGEDKLSTDYDYYYTLLTKANSMGANCIQAKTLLPPEFYRALYSVNRENPDKLLFLIQTIRANESMSPNDALSKDGIEKFENMIKSAVSSVHGDGSIEADNLRNAATYFIDVSPYTLGYIIDCNFTPETINLLSQTDNSYDGTYYNGKNGIQSYAARLGDSLQTFCKEKYNSTVSLGFQIKSETLSGVNWNNQLENAVDISSIAENSSVEKGFFLSVGLSVEDSTFISNSDYFGGYSYDFSYSKYISEVKEAISVPVLVTGVSSSTAVGSISEKEQGQRLVFMLKKIIDTGYMAGIIADLNDDWLAVSKDMYAFVVPDTNNKLWKNVADPAQNTGILSVESPTPEKTGMELADDDRLQGLSVSANECYLYINLQLLNEIDFTNEEAFVGIDTYQRNDGEYYYAAGFTSTSLSGMEFVLRFSEKRSVTLYTAASYDSKSGNFKSQESYSADYRPVLQLPYGGFSKGNGLYYQTGSTIYIRLPWSLLNVTDPSQKLVVDNEGPISEKAKTSSTNGFLFSFLIADKLTMDELYLFPENKQNPGYKIFKWKNWETVEFTIREKESFLIIQNYYMNNK